MAESFPVKFNVFADVGDAIRGFDGLQRTIDTTAGVFRGLNKVLAIGEQVLGAFHKLMDFSRMAADMRQLETTFNKTGASLGRLQQATEGQVSQMKLMGIASKALQGENRLTQQELETVLRAADNLSDKGFGPLVDIQEKLIDAMRKGTTKGLGELGIVMDDTGTKTGNMVSILAELKDLAQDVSAEDALAKRFEQFNTRVEDATQRLKGFLGEIAIGFTLWLDEQLQKLGMMSAGGGLSTRERATNTVLRRRGFRPASEQGGAVGAIASMAEFAPAGAGTGAAGAFDAANKARFLADKSVQVEIAVEEERIKSAVKQHEAFVAIGQSFDQLRVDMERAARQSAEIRRKGGAGGGGGGFRLAFEDVGEREIEIGTGAGITAGGGTEAFVPSSRGRGQEGGGDLGASDTGAGGRVAGGGREQKIEETLQEMEERIKAFQAELADSSSLVGAVYQTTTTLVLSAMDSIIEGNGNILKSWRRALAGQMKASAMQNWARAIEYTARAIGERDPSLAAAAAKAAAAAAAYTLGARLLGGSGGDGGMSGGGAGASAGGGSGFRPSFGGQGGGQNITIIQVGDVFGKRSSDTGAMIDEALRTARRTGRVRDGSTDSVRFR